MTCGEGFSAACWTMAGIQKAFRSERPVNDALRWVIELHKVGSYKQA